MVLVKRVNNIFRAGEKMDEKKRGEREKKRPLSENYRSRERKGEFYRAG